MARERKTTRARRGRGEASVYQRASGEWCASVSDGFDGAGKRIRRVVYAPDKATVMKKLEAARNSTPSSHTQQIKTVGQYLAMWLEEIAKPSIRPKTYYSYENTVRNYLLPGLGKLELGKLTPLTIRRFYRSMEMNAIGARTRNLTHTILSIALKRAVRLDLIPSNPAERVDAPKVPKPVTRALTHEEAERFLAAAQVSRLRHYFAVSIMTGMRPGELSGLQWIDVDFKAATISVRRSLTIAKGPPTIGEPKTKTSRRRIDLPERALAALRDQRELLLSEGLRASPWVFPNARGNPLLFWNLQFRKEFRGLLQEAGIELCRLYDLRHTAATLALVAGIPLKVISERLGHASVQITADTYQHVIPSLQRDAVQRLNDLFGSGVNVANL